MTSRSGARGVVISASKVSGKQLLVVRELPVDPPARQPHVSGAEDHVVLVQPELYLVTPGGKAAELLEGARGDDRVERDAACFERRLLHGEPVRVRRSHDELVAGQADENPCEHGSRLVARRSARHLVDRRQELRRSDRVELAVDRRQAREVLRAVYVEPRRVAARGHGEDAVALLVHERHVLVRQQSREVREELPGNDDGAVSCHLAGDRRPERDLHVRRGEQQAPFFATDEDPAQHLDGTSRRETPRDGRERRGEIGSASRSRGARCWRLGLCS